MERLRANPIEASGYFGNNSVNSREIFRLKQASLSEKGQIVGDLLGLESYSTKAFTAHYIWEKTGSLSQVTQQLNIARESDSRRLVFDSFDQEREDSFKKFNVLLKNDRFVLLHLMNQGYERQHIHRILNKNHSSVSRDFTILFLARILESNHPAAVKHRFLCDKVKSLRNQGKTNAEIAPILGVSRTAVAGAASHLIELGEIQPLSISISRLRAGSQTTLKHKEEVRFHRQSKSIPQIEKATGLTHRQVKYLLYSAPGKEIVKKRQPFQFQKEMLRRALNKHMKLYPAKTFHFNSVMGEGKIRADYYKLREMFAEIAKEQDVPRVIRTWARGRTS